MKTANLAIVFTDIKGFTERTSRQTLEENQRLLDTHERLLAPLFHAFGGRIVKSIGDAFMVTFESPTQAVLCGVAIQDRLFLHNRDCPESQRLEVRVAINVGEVRVENKDVFGEPVNIAARVEGIAEVGEVYFTESVYLSMNKAEVPSEEVGSFELKGIPGKVTVYRVPHAPYRVQAAAPAPNPDLLPFGNLGLSRVREDSSFRRLTDPGELRAAGAQMRGALSRRRPVAIGAAVLGLALLVGAGGWMLRPEAAKAISAVEGTTGPEREAKVQHARAVIAKVENPADRAFWSGRLMEALDEPAGATSHYRTALKAGSSDARSRLVDLLEHEACAVRSSSARVLGELGEVSARGALEDLAEDGGPDDKEGGGLIGKVFGCNSKDAAKAALKQLEGR